MVIDDLKDKIVFLDTAPLIYYIEGHSAYQSVLESLFRMNDRKEFTFITSTITLLEVLVKPLKENRPTIAERYKTILTSSEGIEIISINSIVASKAAELRAGYHFKTPDALQLATAIEYSANFFLTNDMQLNNIREIQSIMLQELQ